MSPVADTAVDPVHVTTMRARATLGMRGWMRAGKSTPFK